MDNKNLIVRYSYKIGDRVWIKDPEYPDDEPVEYEITGYDDGLYSVKPITIPRECFVSVSDECILRRCRKNNYERKNQ